MTENQIGAVACIAIGILFLILAVLFALLKEKGVMLISGFNTLSAEKREQYDKKRMSRDMRNSLFLWSILLFGGGILSYLVSFYFAILAIAVWLVLFLKDVRSDAGKAFEKYSDKPVRR